jgi:hypothetical protein
MLQRSKLFKPHGKTGLLPYDKLEWKAHLDAQKDSCPKVAIIKGDATGVGPEIVAKSLATEETRRICWPAVSGDARVMAGAVQLTKVPLKIVPRKNWDEISGEAGLGVFLCVLCELCEIH